MMSYVSKNEAHLQSGQLSNIVLQGFNGYRLLIIATLLVSQALKDGTPFISFFTTMYHGLSVIYLIFALAMIGITFLRRFSSYTLTVLGVVVDITVLSLLMHFNSQITEVVIILINSVIAIGSIVTAGSIPLLFAALASVATLIIKSGIFITNAWSLDTSFSAGLYSISYFATAMLAFGLSVRIRASEVLASERQETVLSLEHLNQMIIGQMEIGVIVLDELQRILFINPPALQFIDWHHAREPADIQEYSTVFAGAYAAATVFHKKKQFSFTSDVLHISTRVVLLQQDKKRLNYAILFLEDSRKAHQKAQELKLASLGRLTASVAHEIRNPLNAIAQASQLLAEKKHDDPQELALVNIIDRQTYRIDGIVKNILQLPGKRKSEPMVIRIDEWLPLFLQELKSATNVDVQVEHYVASKGLTMLFDQEQLMQVMFNLCDNAAYFSQKNLGEPKFRLCFTGYVARNSCEIRVEDYGPGIKRSQQRYLFEPFFTTKEKGTGLGLYIALQLCQANQATLTYENAPHGGACFVVTTRMRDK